MSNINTLNQRIEKIHGRLSELYQSVSTAPSPPKEILPSALMELGILSEALQNAMEELARQDEQLLSCKDRIEVEQQHYQTLFELVSDGCLVTDTSYTIQKANRAATELLNTQTPLLVGKSLVNLIHNDDRPIFQAKVSQLTWRNRLELSVRVKRNYSDFFEASLTIDTSHDWETNSLVLLWLIRDITEHKQAEIVLEQSNYDPYEGRLRHFYSKGEIISLEPQKIWLVYEGIVKLTTLSDRGEEMLVGLAGDSMIFGSSLTSLHTYQAIALSEVELVSIQLAEIAQSPRLAQALLPRINQRLQQTESLLSIYGQIRVEDRLHHLLSLLKQVIGQPVEHGTRLKVRLTHQDFASACCTTRVTITRLFGKLQQEGAILLDGQNHLILRDQS